MTEKTPPRSPRRLKPPAEFAAGKQRGKPFAPGVSGNPRGKPRGARNLTARALDELAAGSAEKIVRRMITRAARSDTAAAALLARIWPPPRGRTVEFSLPTIRTIDDAAKAVAAAMRAAASGQLTPDEAAQFASMADRYGKLMESSDLERRIAALEQMAGPASPTIDGELDDSQA